MRRRDFIKVVAAAAVAPRTVKAQQNNRISRVAVLFGASVANRIDIERTETFFRDLGWLPGRNLEIQFRWGAGETEVNRAHAKEIVQMRPDVILAVTNSAMAALHREPSDIPTVFVMVSDPVGMHYVESFAKPGGTVTGFTPFEPSLGSKWISLLKEIAPNVEAVGLMYNPEQGNNLASFANPIIAAAPGLGIQSVGRPTGDSADIERLITQIGSQPNGGLIFLPDAFTYAHRQKIVEQVSRLRLPTIYPLRGFCEVSGLMSYGIDIIQIQRNAVAYVSRILRDTKPADLPVQAPTKFELLINLKAAKAIGLNVPATLLARADEVIE